MLAIFAIGGDVDGKSLRPENVSDASREMLIVFNEQNAHFQANPEQENADDLSHEAKPSLNVAVQGTVERGRYFGGHAANKGDHTMPSDLKDETIPQASAEPKAEKRQASGTVRAILGGVMVLAGAAVGAGAVGFTRPAVQMAPASPIAISSLSGGGIVTVKGKVAEIYGNKFVLSDPSGRALVDTGPTGEGGKLVASGEVISVQGRFESGSIHAAYLILADGRVEALAPASPPPPRDWLHRLIGPH